MIKKTLFTLFLVLFQTVVFAATNTYSGSTTVGGKLLWSTAANWSLGAVPTATDDVVIPSGKTVILDVTSVSANSINISGTLDLNKSADIIINTQLIVVTSPGGHINFDHSIIRLPSNVALYLQNGSGSLNGSCNNNDEVFVGTVQYAVCVGGGALYLFAEIEAAGGINIVTAGVISASQSICSGATPATLTSTTAGTGSGTITYEWQTNATGSFVTIPSATSSTYSPPALTASTSYKRRTKSVFAGYTFYSAYTTAVTITVNALPDNTGTGFSSSSFCIGNQATITFNANNGSGVLPYTLSYRNDTTLAIATETITTNSPATINLSPNPTSTTHYTLLSITDANGCVNLSPSDATAEVTIVPLPSTPIVETITQPTCSVPTGSVVLSGLPSGNWTMNPGGITGSTTSTTVSGLAGGIYNFTVTNASGCMSASAAVTITPLVTNTYTGTWSTGSPPTSNQKIVFNTGYNSTGDLEGCSCQINSGTIIINSGHTLKITNAVTVSGGSLTFENNASLVQVNDVAVNSGTITYKRNTTPVRRYDFTYWSSPVAGYDLGEVSPNTLWDKFYSFAPDADDWAQESSATTMTVGQGYAIRAPQDHDLITATPFSAVFVGVPNNGGYSLTGVNPDKSYLLGNPYPSALDADTFLTANAGVLDGTIYFWTHNSSPSNTIAGDDLYNYTSDDYASYNRVGGVGTAATTPGVSSSAPSGKIASGQGFFVSSKIAPISGSTVVFNNGMRVGVGTITGDNSQFFRIGNTKVKSVNAIEKHRIWLNLSNDRGAFKQTLIGYVTSATNGHDGPFDGESFDGNEYVDFYSVNQDKNLVIQGRSLPFEETDTVSLGYRTTIEGVFTINIDAVDGLLVDQAVFIEDKETKVIHNLKDGAYSFMTKIGTFNDRFVLRYINRTLSASKFQKEKESVLVFHKNKQLQINSTEELIDKVAIYDLSGRKMYQRSNINDINFSVLNLVSNHQVVLINIVFQNGRSVVRKIVY